MRFAHPLIVSLILALLAARLLLPSRLDSALEVDAGHLLHQWENLAYTAAFVSAAVLLFTHPGLPLPVRLLSSAGKCTLTCYITQTLVFTFLFFVRFNIENCVNLLLSRYYCIFGVIGQE